MYLLSQKRPQGDLRATNRQDSTDPAVVVRPSISRTRKITFPAPSTSRSDLLGQLTMRAIGGEGLASRRSPRGVRCCLVCSAPSKRRAHHQPKRYTSQRCRQPSLLSRAGRRSASKRSRAKLLPATFYWGQTFSAHASTRRRTAPCTHSTHCDVRGDALRALHRHS